MMKSLWAWLGFGRKAVEHGYWVVTISRGDILVLKAGRVLRQEEKEGMSPWLKAAAERFGIEIMILEAPLEIAMLLKFHDKGGNDPADAENNGDQPTPLPEVKIYGSVHDPR